MRLPSRKANCTRLVKTVLFLIIAFYKITVVSPVKKGSNLNLGGKDAVDGVAKHSNDEEDSNLVLLVKLGGSSITDKGKIETINSTMLDWVSSIVSSALQLSEKKAGSKGRMKIVIVHGAGSFGHHVAKDYGLRGGGYHSSPPIHLPNIQRDRTLNEDGKDRLMRKSFMRSMEGLAKTRLSVQKLNLEVVQSLLRYHVPAVAISPFSIPYMRPNGQDEGGSMTALASVVRDALKADLVPVVHGDACLWDTEDMLLPAAGIIGGDHLMSGIGTHTAVRNLVSSVRRIRVLFLTDVDGVYTIDPNIERSDEDGPTELLPSIEVDRSGVILETQVCATGSRHKHDVTGGLQTKLKAAIDIAKEGIDVMIIRCGSRSAEQAIRGEAVDRGTIVKLRQK